MGAEQKTGTSPEARGPQVQSYPEVGEEGCTRSTGMSRFSWFLML